MNEYEIKIRQRCFTVTEEMDKVLKILDTWGLTFALCDSDLLQMTKEIVQSLKDE